MHSNVSPLRPVGPAFVSALTPGSSSTPCPTSTPPRCAPSPGSRGQSQSDSLLAGLWGHEADRRACNAQGSWLWKGGGQWKPFVAATNNAIETGFVEYRDNGGSHEVAISVRWRLSSLSALRHSCPLPRAGLLPPPYPPLLAQVTRHGMLFAGGSGRGPLDAAPDAGRQPQPHATRPTHRSGRSPRRCSSSSSSSGRRPSRS